MKWSLRREKVKWARPSGMDGIGLRVCLPQIEEKVLSHITQKRWNFLFQPVSRIRGFQSAFPDGDDMPAAIADFVFMTKIAGAVSFDLRLPPFGPALGNSEVRTVFMPVPEAAVNEDHRAVFRQHQIRATGKQAVERAVDGETIAKAVEHRTQGEFRLGIASPDAGHDLGALLRGEDVHGGIKTWILKSAMITADVDSGTVHDLFDGGETDADKDAPGLPAAAGILQSDVKRGIEAAEAGGELGFRGLPIGGEALPDVILFTTEGVEGHRDVRRVALAILDEFPIVAET